MSSIVQLETCGGLATDPDAFQRVAAGFRANPWVREPLAAHNPVDGAIALIMHVEAADAAGAASLAEAAVVASLAQAGLAADPAVIC